MQTFDIPAQPLAQALRQFAEQTGLQLAFESSLAEGRQSPRIQGRLSKKQVLEQLLAGTGLRYDWLDSRTVALSPIPVSSTRSISSSTFRLAQADGLQRPATDEDTRMEPGATRTSAEPRESLESGKGVPEVLVKGAKTINADIRRTEDDTQPYVVFDSQEIRRSQAVSLDDFLKTRLPMNTTQQSNNQSPTNVAGTSQISLRGLGANQTLILLDGRRMANSYNQGVFVQPDVNSIPLSAIERIEVLPSTASGIYGGGATGGVINIITRKDYVGADLSATYGNTSRQDASNYRLEGGTGFAMEEGRTHLLLTGSYAKSDALLNDRRDFVARSRALLLANNPSAFYSTSTPTVSRLSNIRSQDGSNLVLKNGTALGSPFTSVPDGYAGTATDNGAALVANAGRYDLGLADIAAAGRLAMLAGAETGALSLNLRRDFSDTVDGFADVTWLDNRNLGYFTGVPSNTTLASNAPNNPFTKAITVSFPATGIFAPITVENQSLRAAAGVIVRLPRDWTAAADYVWSRARNDRVFTSDSLGDPDGAGPGVSVTTALSSGTLDVLRDLNQYPLDWSRYLLPRQISGVHRSVSSMT